MNKKEMRKTMLNRHYERLTKLALECGVKNPDGKKLSLKLWKLEMAATKLTTDYCNGEPYICDKEDALDVALEPIESAVMVLFNGKLEGFHINRDPRGCALKINEDSPHQGFLERDWGGYGLLSPTIEAV